MLKVELVIHVTGDREMGMQSNIVICIQYMTKEKKLVFSQEGETFLSEEEISIKMKKASSDTVIAFEVEDCPQEYLEVREEIAEAFAAKWEEVQKKRRENYESGFEADESDEAEESDDDMEADGLIVQPYDPDSITVAPGKYSLREIVGMIDGDEDDEPTLDLAPEFQRGYVWDLTRKCRLIESILLNIPLPVFYFARNKDGKLHVVDGVQRLTTIHNYFHNKFPLSRLEYLGEECNGKYFKEDDSAKSLHPKLYRALRKYQIDCNIIEPSTPEAVKLDIFKRLNTGGKALNRQEIRHAFMKRSVRDFLKELAQSPQFQVATDGSVKGTRMMDQELVLRYIGFYSIYINPFLNVTYRSQMNEFLDDVAVKLNECRKVPYDSIRSGFLNSMEKAAIMFGKQAFRRVELLPTGEFNTVRNPINKSLFIAFSVLLPKFSMEQIQSKGSILGNFAGFLMDDMEFFSIISQNTNHQLKDAVKKLESFLEKIYGNVAEDGA